MAKPVEARPGRLEYVNVFLNSEHVGCLYDTSPLSFKYAASWLGKRDAEPIATIALSSAPQDTPNVQAFFENLLAEGELRDYIASSRHASSLFSLLREVAGDTAGAYVILPPETKPAPPTYVPTTWNAIGKALNKVSAAAIDLQGAQTRISLAGAQDKASIAIFSDGIPCLPEGHSPSTHILKPNIKRLDKVWDSAINETIVMLTAMRCGLPTAEVFYEPHTRACIVKRFDRVMAHGLLSRVVQYDLCQLSGVLSDRKYENDGGPGILQCATLIRQYSSQPARDLRLFAQWIFFNLFVGNNDGHAKNLSLYETPEKGLILTPFYDLMCTRIYPGLANDFAMSVGTEKHPGKITRRHIEEMAEQLGIRAAFLSNLASELAARIPDAAAWAVQSVVVVPALPHSARVLAERLESFIVSTTRKMAQRIAS